MITLRPNRPKPFVKPKIRTNRPLKKQPLTFPAKKSVTAKTQSSKNHPIKRSKQQNENTQLRYNDLRNNQRREVIRQLRKGSVLIPHLFSTIKPDPRMPLERVGVSRASGVIDVNVLAKYTKNTKLIQFFENIAVNKSWINLENYKKYNVFIKLDNVIQTIGEKRFTNLINTKTKQQILLNKILANSSTKSGIDALANIADAHEKIIKPTELNSRAAAASIKSVLRHGKKVEKHNTIERRKLLNEISRIQENGKKVINPKQQREIIRLLMSEKSAFISNNVLKRFITTRAGVFVLVNWIKMEKGDRVFQTLTKNPKLRYDFGKYITSPIGLRSLNHALSTPLRRNFFSRAILLAEEFKEHEAVFRVVEHFIKDPKFKRLPKLEKEMPKDLAKFLKQAMNKVRNSDI